MMEIPAANGVGIAEHTLNLAVFQNACFPIHAMKNLANDSVPLAARWFLLALVACLHIAGAAALSTLSDPSRHDAGPAVLRASWIDNSSPASLLPPSAIQPAEPLLDRRPAPRPRAQSRIPVAPHPRPEAVQSALAPADTAILENLAAQDDSAPAPGNDASTTVTAAAANETDVGNGDNGEGYWGRSYVGPGLNASYFSNPEPEYPSLSRRLREQGLVKLRVHVTEQGRAGEVMLHKSSGYERLDKAALDAVRNWRFRPAQRAGTPVAAWVVVPIRFELQG